MTRHIRGYVKIEKKKRCEFGNRKTWSNRHRRLLPFSLEMVLHFRLLNVPSSRTKDNAIDSYTISFNHIYEPRTEKQALGPATMIVRCTHPVSIAVSLAGLPRLEPEVIATLDESGEL